MKNLAELYTWKDWSELDDHSMCLLSMDIAKILFPISHCVGDIMGHACVQAMTDKHNKKAYSFFDSRTVETRKSFVSALVEAIEERVMKYAPDSGISYQELMWASHEFLNDHLKDVDE